MANDSGQMALFETEAIVQAPELSPGVLNKFVAFGYFAPLKLLNCYSTSSILFMPEGWQSCRQDGKQPAGMRCPGGQWEIAGWCVRIQEKMGVVTASFSLLNTERTHLHLQPLSQRVRMPRQSEPQGRQTQYHHLTDETGSGREEAWPRAHSKYGWCFQQQVLQGIKRKELETRKHQKQRSTEIFYPGKHVGLYTTAHRGMSPT